MDRVSCSSLPARFCLGAFELTGHPTQDRLGWVYPALDRESSASVRLRELCPPEAVRDGIRVIVEAARGQEFLERGRRLGLAVMELPEGLFWVSPDPCGDPPCEGDAEALGALALQLQAWHAAGLGHGALTREKLRRGPLGLAVLDPLGEPEGDLKALDGLARALAGPCRPLLWASGSRNLEEFRALLAKRPRACLDCTLSSDPGPPGKRCLAGHRGWVRCLGFAGPQLLSGSEDRTVRRWDWSSGEARSEDLGAWVSALTTHQGKVAVVTQDGKLYLDGLPILTGALPLLAFSPDGQTLAVGSRGGVVRLVALDGTERARLTPHPEPLYAVAFSPDGQLVAVAAGDNHIHLWDPAGALLERRAGHSAAVRCLTFLPDGRLISGGIDRTLRLWDLYSSNPPQILSAHESSLRCVAAHPGGRGLASAGTDKSVRWWPLNTLEPQNLGQHQGEVSALAFSPDGGWLASGGQDDAVRLWELPQ